MGENLSTSSHTGATSVAPALPEAADVILMLRAHAEQLWLSREVIPVLRQLEMHDGSDEQLAAAVAYLEVIWLEALRHARETETARQEHERARAEEQGEVIPSRANRYHAAIKNLREVVSLRIERLRATAPGLSLGDLASLDVSAGD